MKHVFVIHSNVVLLSALGTIDFLKLSHSSILFLYGRHFQSSIVKNDIKTIDISDIYFKYPKLSLRCNPFQYKRYFSEIDSIINNIIKDDYEIYLPHFGMVIYQALMTNKKCNGINILQEGAYSYFSRPYANPLRVRLLNLFFSSPRRWFQKNWNLPLSIAKRMPIHKSFAISKDFFEPLNGFEHIVIKWPHIDDDRCFLPKGSHVFLFESAVELDQIEKDVYFAGCKKLIETCSVSNCYVKFHPNQNKNNIRTILEMFNSIHVSIIPDDVPFEITMANSSDLTLYGFTTSLLKFGELLGHNVIRKDDFLKINSRKFAYYCAAMN